MIDSRASSAAAQPTLSPSPSPERNDRRANLYTPSDIRPYGEAPLVSTTKRNEGRTLRPFCVSRVSVTYAKYAPSSSHLK